jgi:hypothetical protein
MHKILATMGGIIHQISKQATIMPLLKLTQQASTLTTQAFLGI